MSEYPVIKTPTPVDSILTFRGNGDVFKVVGCDPFCYGEKGYTLHLVQIGAVEERNHLIGREMTIDDRAFREYSGNKIKITKPKTTKKGKDIMNPTNVVSINDNRLIIERVGRKWFLDYVHTGQSGEKRVKRDFDWFSDLSRDVEELLGNED